MKIYCTTKNTGPTFSGPDPLYAMYIGASLKNAISAVGAFELILTTHMRHPDHVLNAVKIGVPYQDKASISLDIAESYFGVVLPETAGFCAGLDEFPYASSLAQEYDQMLTKVRSGLDMMKEEYYAMMTDGG